METTSYKMVTIISETVLSSSLTNLAQSLGASGFTLTEVRGEGSGGKSTGELPDLKIKVEIVCDTELAKKIMTEVAAQFFENYSLIVYSQDIEIIRQSKF